MMLTYADRGVFTKHNIIRILYLSFAILLITMHVSAWFFLVIRPIQHSFADRDIHLYIICVRAIRIAL